MTPQTFKVGPYETKITYPNDPSTLLEGASLVVVDEHTKELLSSHNLPMVVLKSGEEHKTWASLELILKGALEAGLGRDSVILGVGGGVLTDMTALAASLYMRGCGLTLVPTTLLAMVDASFGGKTGFDFQGYKNMVGTFYPAQNLRIWTGALKTLPQREYICGLGEVLKAGLLGDKDLWNYLKTERKAVLERDPQAVDRIVSSSLMVKGTVVERDFKEMGERAFLNLGHTFAHALEAVVQFKDWNHGEAVGWGIARALDLSVELGLAQGAYRDEVHQVLGDYGFRLKAPGTSAETLLSAMKNDKKKKAGQVRFVLQRGITENLLQTVDDERVLSILKRGV